ncbi:MAG: hypothetical protein QW562_06895 [Thermosphaera sp.]
MPTLVATLAIDLADSRTSEYGSVDLRVISNAKLVFFDLNTQYVSPLTPIVPSSQYSLSTSLVD